MRDKKSLLVKLIILCIFIVSFVFALINEEVLNIMLISILMTIITILVLLLNENSKSNEKILKSLVKNSNTIYIMINAKTKNIEYLSKNVEDILGIDIGKLSNDNIVRQIFNIPIIKKELKNWDKEDDYVGQMIEYDNPKYNHNMWIKIKIFQYQEKNNKYYVIRIIDSTKDHERQHMLVSQAASIKTREGILNEITSKSYDLNINVNLTLNHSELKYFKKDNLYFGEEKSGKYTEQLKTVLECINEKDRDLVYSTLNIDSLKEHFLKYELDSIVLRYRIGNQPKNNIWLESTVFFITHRQKNVVYILTKNVTENAQSIREQNVMLQNALNEAKLINKTKNEIISTISHEIRTPLTNVVGISESLLSEDIDSNFREDVKNINASSKEMVYIIDDLLNTTKVDKAIVEKSEGQYNIYTMFKKIETSAKEYIGDKAITLNINLDNNLPVVLYGDYRRITRSINEIMNNSIKNTDEGVIQLTARGEKIGNNVKLILEITDSGSGIDEEKLNSIISEGSQKGIGSVKNLVELLNGKLEIESKVGEYTKVTITLIQKIIEDNKVRKLVNNNKVAEEFSLKGKKILIVDDNKLNLKVTNRLLKPYELNVTLLESGEECLALIKEESDFDLILMDQMMPGLDGTTTMTKLKEIENFDIPIVVLTADAMEGQKEKYLASGFDDYISKPIDKKELSRVLKKFLKDQ